MTTTEFKNAFDLTACFYYNNIKEVKNNQFPYRKYIDIVKNGNTSKQCDIMFVMMNPGSAKKKDKIEVPELPRVEEYHELEISIEPDPTIKVIAALMGNTGFNNARIINLSDVREPSSTLFLKELKTHREKNTLDSFLQTSIFHNSRKEDLEKYFQKNIPVIIAWGIADKLSPLTSMAYSKLDSMQKTLGLKKDGSEYSYYHPLRRKIINSKVIFKKTWLEEMTELMQKT
jgi:hypothetical protein